MCCSRCFPGECTPLTTAHLWGPATHRCPAGLPCPAEHSSDAHKRPRPRRCHSASVWTMTRFVFFLAFCWSPGQTNGPLWSTVTPILTDVGSSALGSPGRAPVTTPWPPRYWDALHRSPMTPWASSPRALSPSLPEPPFFLSLLWELQASPNPTTQGTFLSLLRGGPAGLHISTDPLCFLFFLMFNLVFEREGVSGGEADRKGRWIRSELWADRLTAVSPI